MESTGFHNNPHMCFRNDGTGMVELHRLYAKRESDDVSVEKYIIDIVSRVHDVLTSGKYAADDIMIFD